MAKIHFIERITHFELVDKDNHIWNSLAWALTEETAKKLIGAEIYFHRGQSLPSHFGGVIESYWVIDSGPDEGRIGFRMKADQKYKGIKTSKDGWSFEKKIEWD
jgi:hypothetical protein